mgnify:CR=1 FL=1
MKLKLRKPKEKRSKIDQRIKAYFRQYGGSLPERNAHNKDALSIKVVIEGSIHVGWRLLEDARTEENFAMERDLRESFIAARKRLNVLIELAETEKGGITIG